MADQADRAREFFSEFRISRRLSPARLVLLALGFSFCLGFIILYPHIASESLGLSYLLVGLMVGFTAWTVLDLLKSSPEPYGFYRLALGARTDWLSSLEGWLLLGGELVLAALLGRAFARYALALVSTSPPGWVFYAATAGIVLLTTLPNILGKGQRRLQTLLIGLPFVAYGLSLVIGRLTGSPFVALEPSQHAAPGSLWATTALALIGFWGLEAALAESETLRRFPANLPKVTVALAILIPLVAGASVRVAPAPSAGIASWGFWTAWGPTVTGAFACLLIAGALWWVLLIMGRQGVVLARHGFLPSPLASLHRRLQTPIAFQALSGAAALVLALLIPLRNLLPLASFAWGLGAIGLNTAAIIGYYRRPPADRATSLPFFPLIPGLGIAGMLFLLLFLPASAWLAVALWVGAGLGLYALYGIRWRARRRMGITIFKEEEVLERPRPAFRVLVPVANPKTAQHLVSLAISLAKPRQGDIVALQVVETPAQVSIASGRRIARTQLHALKAATDKMEEAGVPVHAMTRLAQHAHEGILDTAQEEGCNLIVLGWTQRATAVPGSLGKILNAVLDNATCDVLIVSGQFPDQPRSILVPTAGGPHAEKALQLANQLAEATGAGVTVLHILPPDATDEQETTARQRMEGWLKSFTEAVAAEGKVVRAGNVVQSIVQEAQQADLVMMGTSTQSWLDRMLFGVIPDQVASRSEKPVILTRAYTGMARLWGLRIWESLYNLFPTLESDETLALYRNLREGARGNVNYYVLTVLSAIIASLGLLGNSAAVIIGAMLVAPFMTPILALSLGIVLGEPRMLSRGVESAIKGIGASIVLAAFTALLFPIPEMTSEILARTRPTLLDLAIALASGAAGAYALARKELAAALPGVAIAAALMPPVCVIGIGVATGSGAVVGGATLLFVTNLIAIALAGALIFLLLGIRPTPRDKARREWLRRGLVLSLVLLVVVAVLLAGIMFRASRSVSQQELIHTVLSAHLGQIESTRLLSVDSAERQGDAWYIEATIQSPASPESGQVRRVSQALAEALDRPVHLKFRVVLTTEIDASAHPQGTE